MLESKLSSRKMRNLRVQSEQISKLLSEKLKEISFLCGSEVAIDTLDHESYGMVKATKLLADFLKELTKDHNDSTELIVLNNETFFTIRMVNKEIAEQCRYLYLARQHQKSLLVSESAFTILEILNKHFLFIARQRTLRFGGVFSYYRQVYKSIHIKSRMLLNKLENAEEDIRTLKENLELLEKEKGIFAEERLYLKLCYYDLKALFYIKKGLLSEAEVYITKSESLIFIQIKNENLYGSLALDENYSLIRTLLFTSGDLIKAIHFSKNQLEYYQIMDKAFLVETLKLEPQAYQTIEIETVDHKDFIEKTLTFINFCKFRLLQKNIAEIKGIDLSLIGKVLCPDLPIKREQASQFKLEILLHPNCDINLLKEYLNENDINFTISDSKLILNKFYKVDLKSLKFINDELLPDMKQDTNYSKSVVASTDENCSTSFSNYSKVTQSEIIDSTLLTNRNPLSFLRDKRNITKTNVGKEEKEIYTAPPKTIKFNNLYQYVKNDSTQRNVYKLHGFGVHRQYVYIDPNLKDEILKYENGNKIFKNLVRMCERGKVVSDGVNAKAFIHYTDAKTKVSSYKIKDSKKDYRFFARQCATVIQNNKTHTLNVIDRFKMKHKDKTVVSAPSGSSRPGML